MFVYLHPEGTSDLGPLTQMTQTSDLRPQTLSRFLWTSSASSSVSLFTFAFAFQNFQNVNWLVKSMNVKSLE